MRRPMLHYLRDVMLASIVLAAAVTLFPRHALGTEQPEWRALERGMEHALIGGDFRLELLRFDLGRFRVHVAVAEAGRGKRRTASEVLAEGNGAVAVVNGGFFDGKGRPLGLRIDGGKILVPFRRKVDWGVFFVSDRRAHVVHSREFSPSRGIEAAIQVGPRILIDGNVPRLKPQIARRTAVALDKDNRRLTLVIAPDPVAADALGARLAELGYVAALMLDGGPSTQLAARIEIAGRRSKHPSAEVMEIPGAYGVPDLLVVAHRKQTSAAHARGARQ
jgi:uncharacterized protein YigE (DUF2233 family)